MIMISRSGSTYYSSVSMETNSAAIKARLPKFGIWMDGCKAEWLCPTQQKTISLFSIWAPSIDNKKTNCNHNADYWRQQLLYAFPSTSSWHSSQSNWAKVKLRECWWICFGWCSCCCCCCCGACALSDVQPRHLALRLPPASWEEKRHQSIANRKQKSSNQTNWSLNWSRCCCCCCRCLCLGAYNRPELLRLRQRLWHVALAGGPTCPSQRLWRQQRCQQWRRLRLRIWVWC